MPYVRKKFTRGQTIMNKWGIFASGFCAAVNAYALFISVFGDFTLVLITKAEWVLSEHPGWRFALASFCLVGLVCSIYSAWSTEERS